MKTNNTKEFEKKIYKAPQLKEIGRVIAYTKNQGSNNWDNGSTTQPRYSS